LAVAGRSGTLKMRFKGTIVEGNLWAKSGTLTGVSALSGYLNPPNYQPIVFSILVNQSPSTNLRQEIDQIILLFSQLSPC
jgi:D-alanyl-D-alanine carboxypeptidase/D-alanyl-D-alanine-endopeptidase (penicillin-binding protein 4)